MRRDNDEMLAKSMVVCSSLMGSEEGECSKETTDHIFKSERISCIGVAGVLCRRGNVSAQREPPHTHWPPSHLLYLGLHQQ